MRQWLSGWRQWPWGKIALGLIGAFALVAVVPPLRTMAMVASSRTILFVASPLTPGMEGFERLPATSRVVAADGSLLAELDGGERRDPVTVEGLPEHVVRAVLAAEDANFYDHAGIDTSAVFRAFLRTAQGGRQGGSTITQQLAKINYTGGERTVFRKLREVLYASELEDRYSKDELLERYLNQVYFGDGAYGIASAADAYFGVAPSQLTPAQAALLAGKIRAPEGLDPREEPEAMQKRRNQVLRNMNRRGWLDDDAMTKAAAEPIQVIAERPPRVLKAPHFVEFVKREAAGIDALGGTAEARANSLVSGGYVIETTLDVATYDASAEAVGSQLGAPEDPATSVVSITPGDGAIRNLFDGLNFDRKFDVATLGKRQPGSAFKPFVYLAALRDGIDPRSTLDSRSPMELESPLSGTFVVNNYEGKGGGPVSIDQAMAQSINTVFSQVAIEVGIPNVLRTARQAGIDHEIKPFPAVALGGLSEGVSPLQMAAAYATFAAKGVYAEPYAINRILDAKGRVVYQHRPRTQDAYAATEVGVLNSALVRVVEEGTGRGADIGRPVAGKTGTTQDYGDAWFAGFVPQLATAVWVGNPEKVVPMKDVHGVDVTGGSFPASIFKATMETAVADLPVEPIFTSSPESLSLQPFRATRTGVPTPAPSTTLPPTSTTAVTAVQETTTTLPPLRQEPRQTTTTSAPPPRETTTTTSTTRPQQTTTSTTTKDRNSGASTDGGSTPTTSPSG